MESEKVKHISRFLVKKFLEDHLCEEYGTKVTLKQVIEEVNFGGLILSAPKDRGNKTLARNRSDRIAAPDR